jgi:hypothetical protein
MTQFTMPITVEPIIEETKGYLFDELTKVMAVLYRLGTFTKIEALTLQMSYLYILPH